MNIIFMSFRKWSVIYVFQQTKEIYDIEIVKVIFWNFVKVICTQYIVSLIKLLLVCSNGEGYYCKEDMNIMSYLYFNQSILILMEVVSIQVKLRTDGVKL